MFSPSVIDVFVCCTRFEMGFCGAPCCSPILPCFVEFLVSPPSEQVTFSPNATIDRNTRGLVAPARIWLLIVQTLSLRVFEPIPTLSPSLPSNFACSSVMEQTLQLSNVERLPSAHVLQRLATNRSRLWLIQLHNSATTMLPESHPSIGSGYDKGNPHRRRLWLWKPVHSFFIGIARLPLWMLRLTTSPVCSLDSSGPEATAACPPQDGVFISLIISGSAN